MSDKTKTWNIKVSKMAQNSQCSFKDFSDSCPFSGNAKKSAINLGKGDPSAFGAIKLPETSKTALISAIKCQKFNGYTAIAEENAKASICKLISKPKFAVKSKDIICTIGCSQALEVAISVLGNVGDNILVPKPGYPAYESLCKAYGIEVIHYDLMAEKNWEINLKQVNRLIDLKTAAIIYNNPSNPCGSVYTKEHIEQFLQVAEKNCVPIIADELNSTVVFANIEFNAISHISKTVPILTCNSLSKRFATPGWRCGWIHVYDPSSKFNVNVRAALAIYAKRLGGHSRFIDATLCDIIRKQPKTFHKNYMSLLQTNVNIFLKYLQETPAVKGYPPKGGIFLFVKVDYKKFQSINKEMKFIEALAKEESVWVTPGSYFGAAGYLRIGLHSTPELTRTAAVRFMQFCKRHCGQYI